MNIHAYTTEAVELLTRLIATPSVSREEGAAADILQEFIERRGLPCRRIGNNLLVHDKPDPQRPTLLLNAHIDTVKPVSSWTRDPFRPSLEGDRLYGLGSNDCGGGLVSLLQAYRIVSERQRESLSGKTAQHSEGEPGGSSRPGGEPSGSGGSGGRAGNGGEQGGSSGGYNLVFLASCEEEVSGSGGIALALDELPRIDVAIVGEPTGLQPAIAEKGLMVIDGVARGKSGHAAREEGVNALYEALDDLVWLRDYRFTKESTLLGPTKMTVTVVHAGTQHNVIPDECRFVIDVRTNEHYTNEEVFDFLRRHMRKCELTARSFRLSSSHIDEGHPLVRRCRAMGMTPFGSPTLSDQALMPWPSFKLGPGESCRSHSADEFILVSEINRAIETYVTLLNEE